MAKHVGFLLLIGFAISAIAAASNGASKGDLDFANIAEHLESLTSPSASMGDIKDAVAPYLDNWRNKRSASSSMDNADTASSDVSVELAQQKRQSSENPEFNREKRSTLDEYLISLNEVMTVPKATGDLAKKMKDLIQKLRTICKSACENCSDDDEEDDSYYDDDDDDDDDDFFRFKRNVDDENSETSFEDLVGVVKNINNRAVNRTKSLINAGLNAAKEAVKVAIAMASADPDSSETDSEDFHETPQRSRRSSPDILVSDYLKEVDILLEVLLFDTQNIISAIYQSMSPQGKEAVQLLLSAVKKGFHVIWHILHGSPNSAAQLSSSLDQTLSGRVPSNVNKKMTGQVRERERRSPNDSTSAPDATTQAQPDSQSSSSNASDPNPLVKGLNALTNLTESMSDVLEMVFDLTDLFSLRMKRDIDSVETDGKTSLNIFIEDMKTSNVQVLAAIKELMRRIIQDLGQNVDLGLQRINSALGKQKRSTEDQFELVNLFLREMPHATVIQLKKWFDDAILLTRQLFQHNENGEKILRAIKWNADLAKKSIEEFLAIPDNLKKFEESDYSQVEVNQEKIVSRKRRFALMDSLVGMLVATATQTVADWFDQTANSFTSDYLENPQIEEQDQYSMNRIKRESDQSLLTEIIKFPGKVIEGIVQKGKKRTDALLKVFTGQETEKTSDDVYPGK